MRYLILLLLFILAIAVLVGISQLYLADPILIRYGQWQAEPPVGVALASLLTILVLLVVVFKILVKVISIPFRFSQWHRHSTMEKRQQKLRLGLRALTLGDEKEALKAFSYLIENKKEDPGVLSLLAAMSAKYMGDTVQHTRLLKQAATSKDNAIRTLANATLTHQEGRFIESINAINATEKTDSHTAITKLRLEINRELQDWEQALADTYRLRDRYPARNWDADIKQTIDNQLQSSENIEKLTKFWKDNVQDKDKRNSSLAADYAFALYRLGNEKQAAEVLAKTLKTGQSTPESLVAIAAIGDQKSCEDALANNQKHAEEKSGEKFLPALATLAERLELWGKARRYYQMANAIRPDRHYVQALAELEKKSSTEPSSP